MAVSKGRTTTGAKHKNQETLHGKTEERLRKYLTGGRLTVGDKLKPEVELCEKLGVSRNTLRTALDALEREGYLLRKKRVGTLVMSTVQPTNFSIDFSSTATIRDYLRRTKFEDRVLSRAKIPDVVQRAVGVASHQKWIRVSGVRRELAGQKIVAGIDLYVNPEYASEAEAYGQASDFLYEVIAARRKDRIQRIDFHVSWTPIPERWAGKLGERPGAPVLNLKEVVRRNDGMPLEVASIVFPSSVNFSWSLVPVLP